MPISNSNVSSKLDMSSPLTERLCVLVCDYTTPAATNCDDFLTVNRVLFLFAGCCSAASRCPLDKVEKLIKDDEETLAMWRDAVTPPKRQRRRNPGRLPPHAEAFRSDHAPSAEAHLNDALPPPWKLPDAIENETSI